MQPNDPTEASTPEQNVNANPAPPAPQVYGQVPQPVNPSPVSTLPAAAPGQQAVYPQASSASHNAQLVGSKKKQMIIGALVLVVLIAAVLGIVYAGKSKSPRQTSGSNYSAASTTDSLDDTTDKKIAPAQIVKMPLNKSVVTDFGYSIQVNEEITGFQPEHPETDADVVLFKVTITEQKKPQYTGSDPAAIYFAVEAGGKEYERATLYAGESQSELAAAGYPALEGKPTTGAPVTGYLWFGIPKGSKPTLLRYKQKPTKVLNNGSTIPAKNYDITL